MMESEAKVKNEMLMESINMTRKQPRNPTLKKMTAFQITIATAKPWKRPRKL